jgi:YHS domain-containing protein
VSKAIAQGRILATPFPKLYAKVAMKKLLFAAWACIFLTGSIWAKDLLNTTWTGAAVKGYDPVAYFTDNKAVEGVSDFKSELNGATYFFVSKEHKDLFDANPSKYLPQFGGYCAYGVSINKTVNIDPTAFQIIDGKLYLQYSKAILDKFNQDAAGNLQKAQSNWPTLVESQGK